MRISDWSSDVCSSDLVDFLRYQAEQAHRRRAVLRDLFAEDAYRTRAGIYQRADDAYQGRFASAVGAEQGKKVAGRYAQADAFERLQPAIVGFAQVGDRERGSLFHGRWHWLAGSNLGPRSLVYRVIP